jgi:uncharacterized sulfatase
MTDTQPTHFLGCYAGEDRQTPHLDALAARGTRFERAYTACPLCTPARAALFTGQTPTRSGAFTNSQPLGQTVRSMGQYMTAAGYRCGYIGKWHLDGHDYFGDGECPDGWDGAYWYDGKRYLLDLTPEQVQIWRTMWPWTSENFAKHDIDAEFTWAHRISDRAERFLAEQAHDNRPYLLVCSYDEPHHPFFCPPEYVAPYEGNHPGWDLGPSAFDDLAAKPPHQRSWASGTLGVAEPTGRYCNPAMMGCNAFVDHEIGRVIDAAQALADRTGCPTWIIHTSDHGDHLGTHRLRNKGATAYDANARVPLIVVSPDGGPAIQQSVVSLMDILPSMLELAGVPQPACLDGTSMVSVVGNEDYAADRTAFIEYTRYEVGHDAFGGLLPMRALVRDGWKLVLNGSSGPESDELYHYAVDPDELVNVLRQDEAAAQEQARAMHDNLLQWMDEHEDPWRGAFWDQRSWHQVERDVWSGPMRPVRLNGLQAPYLDYDTGLPTRGVAVQYAEDDDDDEEA